MKYPIILMTMIAVIVSAGCSSQRSTTGDTPVSEMISNRQFTFVARNVTPTEDARYNPRNMFPNASTSLYQLSSGYDLRVTPDSVIAYLPFFGRSYSAPINPSEGGIKFTSTDFEYKQSRRKGNYEIEIVPHDAKDTRNLYLTISPNGYASLRVLSMNKTPISFNGEIAPSK